MTSPREERNVGSYDAAVRAFARMNQDMANLRKFMNPPYLDAVNQLANTMEQVRLQQFEMSQVWMSTVRDSVAHLTDISNSSQHIYGMFTQTGVALDSLSQVHDSWIKRIGDITTYQSQLDAYAKLYLCDTSLQLAATETVLAGIDFDFLKSTFDIPVSTISAMQQSIFDATASYRTLAESIPDLSALVQLPSFVLPGATYELYTAGQALKVLDPLDHPKDEGIEEEVSTFSGEYADNLDFIALLDLVDPELVPIYSGARVALYGDNPDYKRQALASLRELSNNLMRKIAPKEDTIEWLNSNRGKDDFASKDNPSRRGRIRYIARSIDSASLVDFVNDSARASKDLHSFYNKMHALVVGLTDHQLQAILNKTESELGYLIQIWATTATQ